MKILTLKIHKAVENPATLNLSRSVSDRITFGFFETPIK
ncbi:unnamed protein product, partial [Larinioides sclopetarius]